MSNIKKVALVSSSLIGPNSGQKEMLASLDKNMRALLANRSLPDDVKIATYTHYFNIFNEMKNVIKAKQYPIDIEFKRDDAVSLLTTTPLTPRVPGIVPTTASPIPSRPMVIPTTIYEETEDQGVTQSNIQSENIIEEKTKSFSNIKDSILHELPPSLPVKTVMDMIETLPIQFDENGKLIGRPSVNYNELINWLVSSEKKVVPGINTLFSSMLEKEIDPKVLPTKQRREDYENFLLKFIDDRALKNKPVSEKIREYVAHRNLSRTRGKTQSSQLGSGLSCKYIKVNEPPVMYKEWR